MCLGIPGKLIATFEDRGMLMGKIDFGGVFKTVCLSLVPEVAVGQYVIVHVGFALHIIDELEAQQVFAFLEYMDDLDELQSDESNGCELGIVEMDRETPIADNQETST